MRTSIQPAVTWQEEERDRLRGYEERARAALLALSAEERAGAAVWVHPREVLTKVAVEGRVDAGLPIDINDPDRWMNDNLYPVTAELFRSIQQCFGDGTDEFGAYTVYAFDGDRIVTGADALATLA